MYCVIIFWNKIKGMLPWAKPGFFRWGNTCSKNISKNYKKLLKNIQTIFKKYSKNFKKSSKVFKSFLKKIAKNVLF